MKLKEIQNLIKFVAKSGASEVKLEMENVKITIKTTDEKQPIVVQETVPVNVASSAPPTPQVQSPVAAEPAAESLDDNKYIMLHLNRILLYEPFPNNATNRAREYI